MEFKANSGVWGTMFGVPCIVADNFLKLAGGDQIKVLLYILRCSGRAVSAEEISANTGVTPENAENAVLFWQQANVLTAENAQRTAPNIMTAPVQPTVSEVQPQPAVQPTAVPQIPKRELLKPSEISELITRDQDIAELFTVTEQIFGIVNNTMQNSLIWMYTTLGLKKEVIVILLSYCKEINKKDVRNIEQIAAEWAEKEIADLETAQEEVERMSNSRTFVYQIMTIFDMKRKPTTRQMEFVSSWQEKQYSLELIKYAYERTIETIDKLSFEYINKILLSWSDSGFTTLADVKAAESEHRSKKQEKKSGSDGFDADKYKILINNI